MEITNQLIKIILGILVFVAVVLGIYFIFKDRIIDFFQNLGGKKPVEVVLGIIK